MKSLLKISNLVFIAILLLATLYSGILLYNLAGDLEQVSGKIDLSAINEASSVFNKLNLALGLTLFFGLITSLRLLYMLSSKKDQVVVSTSEKTKTQTDSKANDTLDNEKIDQDKLIKELQGSAKSQKYLKDKYETVLAKLCMKLEASQGLFYEVKKEKNKRSIELLTSFAFNLPESETIAYEFGEGLAGQVAKEGKKVNISEIPEGYITIISGLGSASPNNLAIIPIMDGKEVINVVEIASFKELSEDDEKLIAGVMKMEAERKTPKAPSEKKDSKKSN